MTDEEAVKQVKQGNKDAFVVLIDNFEPKLTRYGRKFLSNHDDITDVVQEVFIKVYENLQSFDDSQKFSPWIYRIAHNTFVNELKKKSRVPLNLLDFDTVFAHLTYDDPVETDRDREELKQLLEQGLDQISP